MIKSELYIYCAREYYKLVMAYKSASGVPDYLRIVHNIGYQKAQMWESWIKAKKDREFSQDEYDKLYHHFTALYYRIERKLICINFT